MERLASGSLWRGADVKHPWTSAHATSLVHKYTSAAGRGFFEIARSCLSLESGLALVQSRLALCVAEKPMVIDEWTLSKTD